MPTPDAPTPHDLTLENIRCVADYSDDACGCEHRGDRWFMCAYHEGYDDGVERMVWIMERVHGPPMPDPSPDTPNVCPTAEVLVRAQFVDGEVWLVDDEGNEVGVMARSTFDRCVARRARASVGRPTVAETPETPTPGLAERLDERAEPGHVPIVGYSFAADIRAAAAQLRQLDRIKAAAGDARAVADALIESGDIVVPTSAPAAVDLLLRLADALEADDGA
jgi:hypothetical protein